MQSYEFSIATSTQIDLLLELQEQVLGQLPNPEIYVPATRQELSVALDKDIVFAMWHRECLVAAAICIRNRVCSGNLGQKFGAEPTESFTFDAVFVHPEHRGCGLQRLLIEEAKKLAKEEGAASMWCTVSPKNLFSYQNFTKAGFVPVAQNVVMYGDKIRDVLKLAL